MENKFIVETSARHAHLSREAVEALFGAGAKLTPKKDLSQPGQFACNERIKVVTEKGELNMVIIGPERPQTQVEVSATDARVLGLIPPVRESGDIDGSFGCKLVGPKGEINIDKGVILSKRHLHLDPETAKNLKLNDKQIIWVKIETEDRSVIFGDVVARVSPSYATALHIDTDESNAAGIKDTVYGTVFDKA